MMERIAEGICRLKATEEPLSADVFIIPGEKSNWFFDVGSSRDHLEGVLAVNDPRTIVISHFHPDHMGNLPEIPREELYVGRNTYKYTGTGTVVEKELTVEDGHSFRIMPFPSTHAKGSLALEVDGTYLFTGDGLDATMKNGAAVFNAGLLLEDIRLLERLDAKYVIQSHYEKFCVPKEEVLSELKEIYSLRQENSPYIPVDH